MGPKAPSVADAKASLVCEGTWKGGKVRSVTVKMAAEWQQPRWLSQLPAVVWVRMRIGNRLIPARPLTPHQ